ncbi:MAG: PEGA domain-containing protein [Archangiaceae bacterium]|nr:PEGA domain-containing protein [Archangiaceae bacterium]
MRLARPLGVALIVASFCSHAQVFEGLDLTPKKKARKTGVVVTLTAPVAGAQLIIDGEPPIPLPMEEKTLKPGEHSLKVERPGYRTLTETVTIVAAKKNEFSFTLVATGAVVAVESPTEGATASIDGAPAESLPLSKVLDAGRHEVTVSADGFKAKQQTVEVVAGVDQSISIALVPGTDAPVAVDLTPDGDSDLDLELAGKRSAKVTPLYARWYVWAGVAAVVVAGVVTGVAVSQAPKPTPDPTVVCGGPCDATIGWPAGVR